MVNVTTERHEPAWEFWLVIDDDRHNFGPFDSIGDILGVLHGCISRGLRMSPIQAGDGPLNG